MTSWTIWAVDKDIKNKKKKKDFADNHRPNILRLFDALENIIFTTSKTKRDY